MSKIINGDDGLIAESVKSQSKDKHLHLKRYVSICGGVRNKFASWAESTYLDLFCATGRALIEDTEEWVDGSSLVAWKTSREMRAPFSRVFVADIDEERKSAATERLLRDSAPVSQLEGSAVEAAQQFVERANPAGYHFAFIDPYNLGELNFDIFKALLRLKHIDILVHFSLMDFRRNFGIYSESENSRLDAVAPGWREKVTSSSPHGRDMFFEHWRTLIAGQQAELSPKFRIIKGPTGQELYGLLLAAKHNLAHKFWDELDKARQLPLL